jgi:hypothetical protein
MAGKMKFKACREFCAEFNVNRPVYLFDGEVEPIKEIYLNLKTVIS